MVVDILEIGRTDFADHSLGYSPVDHSHLGDIDHSFAAHTADNRHCHTPVASNIDFDRTIAAEHTDYIERIAALAGKAERLAEMNWPLA